MNVGYTTHICNVFSLHFVHNHIFFFVPYILQAATCLHSQSSVTKPLVLCSLLSPSLLFCPLFLELWRFLTLCFRWEMFFWEVSHKLEGLDFQKHESERMWTYKCIQKIYKQHLKHLKSKTLCFEIMSFMKFCSNFKLHEILVWILFHEVL